MNVENQLNDTSTVHWHGLHVPAADDGGPHTPIMAGATWSPDFIVMNNASMYWYHPHLHMKTGMQAMRGAAGLIIVRDPEEAELNLPRHYGEDDFPLVVQTQEFNTINQILWRGMHDSIIMVNGTINPALDVPAQVIRLRLLNAAQERNFNFGLSGNQDFFVIGARTKAVIDSGFHLIIANPDKQTLGRDLPAAIASGVRSFKIFMTYDRMRLHDEQILDVMAVARRHGALMMVHAENHGMISWLAGRMVKQGNTLPRYHAICHTRGSEAEAINRIIALGELMDCPLLVVHVSTPEGIESIRQARARGLKVFGETCPQYRFLTAKDIDIGLAGAMVWLLRRTSKR